MSEKAFPNKRNAALGDQLVAFCVSYNSGLDKICEWEKR